MEGSDFRLLFPLLGLQSDHGFLPCPTRSFVLVRLGFSICLRTPWISLPIKLNLKSLVTPNQIRSVQTRSLLLQGKNGQRPRNNLLIPYHDLKSKNRTSLSYFFICCRMFPTVLIKQEYKHLPSLPVLKSGLRGGQPLQSLRRVHTYWKGKTGESRLRSWRVGGLSVGDGRSVCGRRLVGFAGGRRGLHGPLDLPTPPSYQVSTGWV